MAKKSADPLVAEINLNFLIRWGLQNDKETYLISAGKYHTIVGSRETARKHFLSALNSGLDKYTVKTKNHLKIEFCGR